jgi:hypothetical protein
MHKIDEKENCKQRSSFKIWLIFFIFFQTKPSFYTLFAVSQPLLFNLRYAVLVEKAGHFLEKAGHFRKMPGFFSIGQVLVV